MSSGDLSASSVRTNVSTGYRRLDDALHGGFLAGSMVVLNAAASDEVPLLLRGFLQANHEESLLICRTSSSAQTITKGLEDSVKSLVCSDKPVSPARGIIQGKGIENLTDLNLQISEVVASAQPKRLVIEVLSDILLRHKALQTRKWLTELLERVRTKGITTLTVLNPYMHSGEEVQAVVDLFDGNLEIFEKDVEGSLRKFLRVKWMHGVEVGAKEFPLLGLTPQPQTRPPQVKYAKSGDVRIAYQVTGNGPVDMVWAPGTVSHLDLDWEWPPKARFLEKLSSFCRLIRFDKRGTGLSDRPLNVATLEERTDDIRAVMDATQSERAVIFGGSEGANMACVFAATYPERTRSLIIWGGQARWVKTADYPWGQTEDEDRQMIAKLREEWPSVDYLTGGGAGLGRDIDRATLDFWLRYAQASASPSAIVALEEMNSIIDVRDILPIIRVPTLVMNRTGDPVAHVEAARQLAAQIPNARFVEFPGATHSMTAIEPERVLAQIQEFVARTRVEAPTDRFLTTVLSLNIVGSSERAAKLGDAGWRELLDRFYTFSREELIRFRGEKIGTRGDEFLAIFDGPGRAIQCAMAIRDSAVQLGMEVRAGVHSGECERMGGDIGGIAVQIGARISAKAEPGGVFVSSTVKDLVAGSGIQFDDKGVHNLKDIPNEWHLYSVMGLRVLSQFGPREAEVCGSKVRAEQI